MNNIITTKLVTFSGIIRTVLKGALNLYWGLILKRL